MNVDKIHEVIPITEDYGLWHPQEGIVNGHFSPTKPHKIHMIGRLRQGASKIIEDSEYVPDSNKQYIVADMITGYGVAEAVRHYYDLWGGDISKKRAIIQGWGNVGATAAQYLAKYGVSVVGIIDRVDGLINTEGMGPEEMKILFHDREVNTLVAPDIIPFETCNEEIWKIDAEIFVLAAASRLITKSQVEQMIETGLEVISCGANVPFQDN